MKASAHQPFRVVARVIAWRIDGATTRLAQSSIIGFLAWLPSRSAVIPPWFLLTGLAVWLDVIAFRRLRSNPESPLAAATAMITLAVASSTFAAIGPLLLVYRSPVTLAGAALILSACNLNNALMTRGWARATWFSVGGSSAVTLFGVPIAAVLLGYRIGFWDAVALAAGGVFMIGFVAMVASILERQNRELQQALVETELQKDVARNASLLAEVAEAASRAKSTFLANLSHEIRTPLHGILGSAQVLAADPMHPDQARRLETIQTSAGSLLATFNNLLELSSMDAETIQLEVTTFNLGQLVDDACAPFVTSAELRGLAFRTEISAPDSDYLGDALRIRQVLHHLISNAVKFTENGEIQLAANSSAMGLRFEIRDTGVGIAPANVHGIFDRFHQGDSSSTRRFGGAGLGLALVRELVAVMGGVVEVESTVGVGSCFTVDLPVAPTTASPSAEPAPGAISRLGPATCILAAEDNETNQLLLRALMEPLGVRLVIVDNGAAAVEAWRDGDWDLILMDVQMPVMDGTTAAKIIRAEETRTERPYTPILALTANTLPDQVRLYAECGMDAVLPKPLDVRELYGTLEATLARRPPEDSSSPARLPAADQRLQ